MRARASLKNKAKAKKNNNDNIHDIVSEKTDELGREVRASLEAQIQIVEKTITLDGKSYTVPVKVCPPVHGTGAMGRVSAGEFNFGKTGSQVR